MNVHTGFAVKAQNFIVGKYYIFNFIIVQCTENNRADADFFGNFSFVFKTGVLFLDNRASFFDAFIYYVLQPDNFAFSGRHCAVFEGNHAVGDVNHILRPLVAHKLQNLEKLFEMQILLIRDDVKTLVEVVSILAVIRRRQVAGSIKRSAVRAQYQARRHSVCFQIDDLRAFAFLQKIFCAELVDNGLHFIDKEPFARVAVESYAQLFVDTLNVFQSEGFEPFENFVRLFIPAFNQTEILTGFLFHFFVGFGIKTDVQLVYGVYTAFFDLVLIAPMLVSANKLAELRAVVAKVVDTYNVIPEEFEKLVQCAADYSRRKVTYMEGFCNVYRRIIDTNRFAFPLFRRAELFFPVQNFV